MYHPPSSDSKFLNVNVLEDCVDVMSRVDLMMGPFSLYQTKDDIVAPFVMKHSKVTALLTFALMMVTLELVNMGYTAAARSGTRTQLG